MNTSEIRTGGERPGNRTTGANTFTMAFTLHRKRWRGRASLFHTQHGGVPILNCRGQRVTGDL